jgi:fructose-1,6-bisphosphatase/inositol monophosphatase family enzyme
MLNDIEREVIRKFATGTSEVTGAGINVTESDWIRFGLMFLLEVSQIIRRSRFNATNELVSYKVDGSPSLPVEQQIERLLRSRLDRFAPDTNLIGEESGGALSPEMHSVAIDPIDGTWAFLNRSETHTATLAFFRGLEAFLGMVMNPAVGELAYATKNGTARLIQLPMATGSAEGFDLPLADIDSEALLVNMHPARQAGAVWGSLLRAWSEGTIQSVKATAGSPAWSLLDAAKGPFCYVNLWPGKPANPFDLAPGVMLVRGAGGDVIDRDGKPISCSDHSGPFIAGRSRRKLLALAELLSTAVTLANQ